MVVVDGRVEAADAVFEARIADGVDTVDDLRLVLVGAGLRHALAPSLEVQAVALGLTSFGDIESGEPAAGGGGGEIGLRLLPLQHRRARAFAEVNLGLLVFPRRPFLPGADVYEGIFAFAVGLELSLSPEWSCAMRGFAVHLSNGQGLGPHNPAYDGYGVAVGVARSLSAPTLPAAPPSPRAAAWMAVAGAEVGEGDAALLAGARARLAHRLARSMLAAAEVAGGTFAKFSFGEIQTALVGQPAFASAALALGYRRFAGVDIALGTAQVEAHLTPEASLVLMGHHERSSGFGSTSRAAVGLRAFPLARVAVDVGMGFDRLGDDDVFADDHADPYVRIEWIAYANTHGSAVSLFLDRQVSRLNLLGVQVSFAGAADLRQRDRVDGWRPLR